MFMNIYSKVQEILGVLPVELEFVYAICTIILFVIIIWCAIFPIKIMYDLVFK